MKKLIIFLFGASLIVSACDNMVEVDDTQSNRFDLKGMDVFTAESENPSGHTKTVLNQDGGIDWQPGDSIHIFKGKSDCGAFVATIEEQAISSDFMGQLDYSEEDKDAAYWAIYPYSKDNTCNGKSVTVHIPDKQVATEGTFDKKAFVSIAHSDKQTLSFYNVCGGVKISVTAPYIKRIVFKGNAGETLAGDAIVSMDENGRPVVQSITNPRTEITLEAPADKTFEVGKWYYLACLPVSLSNGCSVYFQKGGGYYTVDADISIKDSVSVKRSIWGRIQNADEAAPYTVSPGERVIIYTTTNGSKISIASSYYYPHSYENGYGIIRLFRQSLDSRLFYGKNTLETIIIGDGITSIGDEAFSGCSSLTSITIPDGITSIGDDAFYGCNKLESFISPLASDDNRCLIIKDTLVAFSSAGLDSYTIPSGINNIGKKVFSECSSLTSIVIPEGVKSIDFRAFYDCSSLTNITLPRGLADIGQQAFCKCSSLTSITLPEGVTSIGSYAFYGCSSLTNITIPEGVKSIGNRTFYDCSSLTNITLTRGLTDIGQQAFYNCSSITSITLPEGLTSIGSSAFNNCSGLTSITIPDGVASIGDYTFYNCSKLTNITLPEGVKSIGYRAFYDCSSLTNITLSRGLTDIGQQAFYNCSSITSITLPEGLTSIGSGAFSNCSGLTSITIPEGVKSIDYGTFYYCSSLTNITLPQGLTDIGNRAFYKCSRLMTVKVLGNTPPTLGEEVFSSTAIEWILVPKQSVYLYKGASGWSIYATRIAAIDD